MHERRDTARLPHWAESFLTAEQRRTVRRRFGLAGDDGEHDETLSFRPDDPDDGRGGGGAPAPTSPSALASLTRPVSDVPE